MNKHITSDQSQILFTNAQKILVGGVNSPVRSFRAVGGDPLIMKSGLGKQLFDVNGRSYTDYCLSWGSLIKGHADPGVIAAVKNAIERGTSFGTTTEPEIELAHCIVRNVKSVEQIRCVNSGTEATMSALRLARGFTGRSKIIKFDGCYHGHVDDLLTSAGSGVAQLASSSSKGIPDNHVSNTLSLPYNQCEILKEVIAKHHRDIAAVILEPVAGNMGVIPAQKEFLHLLRSLTEHYGIVLIFDEIMSGFRSSLGCVQEECAITPDLTCFGKIIGAGFPIGAYGGRRDIMQNLAPLGPVYQAGTFSGNPVVMSAGRAVLEQLTNSELNLINTIANQFAAFCNSEFKRLNIAAHIDHYNSMLSIRFQSQQVNNYTEAQAASSDQLYSGLFHYLLADGIYLPPADLESFFISTHHSMEDLDFLAQKIMEYFNLKQ